MDLVHQRPHVGVTVRKLLRLQEPVALRGLPAIIDGHPGESKLLNHRQSVIDLAWSEFAAVAPGAPDGPEGTFRRGIEPHALRNHDLTVIAQRLEVIAAVDSGESAESFHRAA